MDGEERLPVCAECRGRRFENIDGRLVCEECQTVVPDRIETVFEFGATRSTVVTTLRKTTSQKPNEGENKALSWNLYDGFNYILVQMTEALIKCGAPPEIKPCIHQLWASYLSKLEVAYMKPEQPSEQPTGKSQAVNNELDSIIPDWFSQASTGRPDTEGEDGATSDTSSFHFAPAKVPTKKKRRKKKSEVENLRDATDDELTDYQLRAKSRQIRESFMKLAVSGADTDLELAESMVASGTEAGESDFETLSQSSRVSTMKDFVPECFTKEKKTPLRKLLYMKRDEDCYTPKATFRDPDYLTLYKLLSFLHGALLMKGILINHADIIRWVREGHIPLYGAHQLLPESMPLSRSDATVLGGTATKTSTGAPKPIEFRMNTARLLFMLNVRLIPKPPAFVVAAKIIRDLQLPDELEICVRMMDRLVSTSNTGEWKLTTFGQHVEDANVYAAALLLIVLKLILGLDDVTEYKISDFSEQVNNLLSLEPSSGFARKKRRESIRRPPRSEMKTLFVWREWVRFIEFRRLSIERTHVPTAIRRGVVHKMEPEYVLHHAQHDGKLHMHKRFSSNKVTKSTILEERVENILEQFGARLPGEGSARIPQFRPTVYGSHGLAEQLVEFDRAKYGMLEQSFSKSAITFAIDPEAVDEALQKVNHRVKLCLGPAYNNAHVTAPFFASNVPFTHYTRKVDRHAVKLAPLKPEVGPANSNADDYDDVSTQPLPSLVLYLPSCGYWTRNVQLRPAPSTLSQQDWSLLSMQLPATFVWMLNLVSESIEETPKQVYVKLSQLETIIFLRHADLRHTLTNPQALRHRLVHALRKQL